MSKESLNTAEKVLETRGRYLEAMAYALGVDRGLAKRKIDFLLKSHLSGALPSPNYTTDRSEMSKEDIEWTEFIGKVFLTGSPQYEGLSFTIGSRIFALLNEDPKSGYFENLGSWVDMWTDGSGAEKFQMVLNGNLKPEITKEDPLDKEREIASELPQNIIPEAVEFIKEVHSKWHSPLIQEPGYGHSAANLAVGLRLQAEIGKSSKKQREFFREGARRLIKKYGSGIIKNLRDELKFALTEEDLGITTQ